MKNKVFFPQGTLDVLVDVGRLELDGEELVVSGEGYRYTVQEAVRVLREVTTGEDPQQLCGKVALRASLDEELGAELLGNSMLLEDWAYDVVPGLLAAPTSSVDPAVDAGRSEQDVLAELQAVLEE